MEPKFISARSSDFSNQEFRLCILAADERHPLAALKPRKRVHGSTILTDFRIVLDEVTSRNREPQLSLWKKVQ